MIVVPSRVEMFFVSIRVGGILFDLITDFLKTLNTILVDIPTIKTSIEVYRLFNQLK